MNVKKIQRLMGHADIKMTLRYVHPGEEGIVRSGRREARRA